MSTTLFSEILRGCGLSQREAAEFLGVRIDTLKSWGSGRNSAPAGVLAALHELAERQDHAANQVADVWEGAGKLDKIEIGLASDDCEAQTLGWPCVGAHMAVIRRVWEILPADVTIRVVPRGSTLATAAAIDARGG